MSWIWACSHGMWFTGVVVAVAVIVGLLFDRRLDRSQALKLAGVPALSVVAAMLTPVGPKLILAPLATSAAAPYVTEWAAPSFRELTPAVAMAMVCVVALCWARRGGVPWTHIGVLLVATGWILLSSRTVALGAVMMAPLLAALPARAVDKPTRGEHMTLLAGATICLVALALVVPSTSANPGRVPSALNDELGSLPPQSAVLNTYTLGGWLEWRHPHLAPVIDGMTDAYWPEDFSDFERIYAVSAGWQELVAEKGVRYALVEERSPLATALAERLDCRTIGRDEDFVLMQAPGQ